MRAGVTAANLQLDIDPYRDSEGILDGVEVVVSLHVGEGLRRQYFTASQYVRHPAQVLVRESAESPVLALAELVDAALAVVNERIAELDRFTFGVRAGAASIDGSVSGHG